MTVQSRRQVKALLELHGLSPNKHLGQHFLADPNITRKIVSLAGVEPGDPVVEIGPGTGTLTAALEEAGAAVTAIEVDEALLPILQEVTAARIIVADASDIDLGTVVDDRRWTLVSNLPYNVGTSIVLDALRHTPQIARMVVMVQMEVAERFVASAGSKTYGLPSVVVGLHGVADLAFRVPPQVFVPPPRVGSAVVVIDRRPGHPLSERAIEIAAAAFGQRRKMLRRSLSAVFADAESTVARAGLDPTDRPEQLDPTDFIRLAEAGDG